jgi:hypothetical protein
MTDERLAEILQVKEDLEELNGFKEALQTKRFTKVRFIKDGDNAGIDAVVCTDMEVIGEARELILTRTEALIEALNIRYEAL